MKQFSFTKEELGFLGNRQAFIDINTQAIADIDMVMKSFITTNVCPRIGVDPVKQKVTFSVAKGILEVEDARPDGQAPAGSSGNKETGSTGNGKAN